MQFDYNFITSTTSILAVVITLIVFIIESRHSTLALKTDLLFRLQEKFDAAEFLSMRKAAARKLLNREEPNDELSDVLDFFASIGFLYRRKAIDKDLTDYNFSFWMIRYYLCSQEYIAKQRESDPMAWITLEAIANTLMKKEKKEGYPPQSKELLHRFLLGEARLFELNRDN
jgi:hypothetical protein